MLAPASCIPYRQIRAVFDDHTVTVYQAYSDAISSAAIAAQRLDASPLFKTSRMTWIKPSWCWMMYRASYSLKDKGQSNILALKLTRTGFEEILRKAELSQAPDNAREPRPDCVAVPALSSTPAKAETETDISKSSDTTISRGTIRVQWDPERGPRLEKYGYRSVQIGVSGQELVNMIDNHIISIENVTEMALRLNGVVKRDPAISTKELVEQGLIPVERPYPVPDDIANILGMDRASPR